MIKQIGGKTVTLIVKVQLINVKDMMEIEKSRLDLRLYVPKKKPEANGDRWEQDEKKRMGMINSISCQ